MKKNLLVAQSGGPTAAINATLAGVIKQAIKEEQIDQVYGACYGIQGVLEQKFVNLTEKVDTEEKLEKLKRTPAAALGSCRFKLNDIKEDDSQYQEIVDILHKMNIGYFVYIGGNDSMDTVAKLSAYCKEKGVEDIKVIGILCFVRVHAGGRTVVERELSVKLDGGLRVLFADGLAGIVRVVLAAGGAAEQQRERQCERQQSGQMKMFHGLPPWVTG